MEFVTIVIFVTGLIILKLFFVIWHKQLPSPPQDLCGDWNAHNQAVLVWQAVDNADEYEVYLRSGVSNTERWSYVATTQDCIVKINVTSGVHYEAYVTAKNQFGSSMRSAIIQGCPRAMAPTQLTFMSDPTKPCISLTWNPVWSSQGYSIKRKTIKEKDYRVIQTVFDPFTTQIQDASIKYGVSYIYMIVSLDSLGESAASYPIIVRPRVPAPSHFVASTLKDRSATILLNWEPVPDTIAYYIYRHRTDDSINNNPSLLIVLNQPSVSSYEDQTVVNNVKYTYTIIGEDSAGVSSRSISTTGIATLPTTSQLIAEPIHDNQTIILSCTEIANPSGYRTVPSDSQRITEKGIGILSHEFNAKSADTKVKYETTYTDTVQAFDKTINHSSKSNPIKATFLKIIASSERWKSKQEIITCPMISVHFGDLITEKTDAIVVCSMSDQLKCRILKAAGYDEYLISDNDCHQDVNKCIVIGGGRLPCKKIIFFPWRGSATSPNTLEQHLRHVVMHALQFAQQNECKTVSFPAFECGGVGYDVVRVAKTVISESYKQLTTPSYNQIQISFVIYNGKQNIYDEFSRQLRKQQDNSTSNEQSIIPSTWEMTNGVYNLRVNIMKESNEGQLVLSEFRRTMINYNNQNIIRIERIQNERWFRQYEIHKKDFLHRLHRDTEQRLYHGCTNDQTSVQSIIENGFNRSLAGTRHGASYGLGVYFSSKASESHNYTKSSNGQSTRERHMFMCKVLIGKATQGNSSMRTCPPGFQSTTNGSSIYVIYHDTQAYAEYLIVYK